LGKHQKFTLNVANGKPNSRRVGAKRREAAEKSKERYGGTTFTIVGRTHDPSLATRWTPPVSEKHGEAYVGYLSQSTNKSPPHEVLPLDFTPLNVHYPEDWSSYYDSRFDFV
jgi:hypothetical protein